MSYNWLDERRDEARLTDLPVWVMCLGIGFVHLSLLFFVAAIFYGLVTNL